jgi:(S)-citramalyl-CoA lyase
VRSPQRSKEHRVLDRSRNRRSLMVHPALAIERWDEAIAAGADMVCFDLEDGTAPSRKDEARRACLPCFARPAHASVLRLLRINGPRTAHGLRDILALLDLEAPPDGIVIPKVEDPQEVCWVRDLLVARHPQPRVRAADRDAAGARRAHAIACGAGDLGVVPRCGRLFGRAGLGHGLGRAGARARLSSWRRRRRPVSTASTGLGWMRTISTVLRPS